MLIINFQLILNLLTVPFSDLPMDDLMSPAFKKAMGASVQLEDPLKLWAF